MPNRDGTGPEGKGPKTGRQAGKCEGAESAERPLRKGAGSRRGLRRKLQARPRNNLPQGH